jgi:hypothetical protein
LCVAISATLFFTLLVCRRCAPICRLPDSRALNVSLSPSRPNVMRTLVFSISALFKLLYRYLLHSVLRSAHRLNPLLCLRSLIRHCHLLSVLRPFRCNQVRIPRQPHVISERPIAGQLWPGIQVLTQMRATTRTRLPASLRLLARTLMRALGAHVLAQLRLLFRAWPPARPSPYSQMRASVSTDAPVRVTATIGASTDTSTNASAGTPTGVCSALGSVPTIQLWVNHAWCHPTWLRVMMELRQFQDTYDLFRSPTYHLPLLPSHLLPCSHTSMAISLTFPLHNGYLASSVSAYNLLFSRMTSHFRWARPMTYMASHLGRFLCLALALIGKLPLVLMLRRGKQVCGGN